MADEEKDQKDSEDPKVEEQATEDVTPGEDELDEQEGANQLDFILDIPLELSVELGRTKMLVNNLLQLGQGSIVELNKLAGEPLEVYINRKLIARGEVVVVNEKFGVRLTDIITPMDRVKSLAEAS
jgi:flagellar motor switch protein FliN